MSERSAAGTPFAPQKATCTKQRQSSGNNDQVCSSSWKSWRQYLQHVQLCTQPGVHGLVGRCQRGRHGKAAWFEDETGYSRGVRAEKRATVQLCLNVYLASTRISIDARYTARSSRCAPGARQDLALASSYRGTRCGLPHRSLPKGAGEAVARHPRGDEVWLRCARLQLPLGCGALSL